MLLSSRVPPKFIVGIYGTSVFVNYLQRGLPVRVHWENRKKTITWDPPGRLALTHIPITIHKDQERLNAHAVDSAECYAKRAIKNCCIYPVHSERFESNHRIVVTEVFEKDQEHFCHEIVIWSLLTADVYIPYLRDDAPTTTILTTEQPY